MCMYVANTVIYFCFTIYIYSTKINYFNYNRRYSYKQNLNNINSFLLKLYRTGIMDVV